MDVKTIFGLFVILFFSVNSWSYFSAGENDKGVACPKPGEQKLIFKPAGDSLSSNGSFVCVYNSEISKEIENLKNTCSRDTAPSVSYDEIIKSLRVSLALVKPALTELSIQKKISDYLLSLEKTNVANKLSNQQLFKLQNLCMIKQLEGAISLDKAKADCVKENDKYLYGKLFTDLNSYCSVSSKTVTSGTTGLRIPSSSASVAAFGPALFCVGPGGCEPQKPEYSWTAKPCLLAGCFAYPAASLGYNITAVCNESNVGKVVSNPDGKNKAVCFKNDNWGDALAGISTVDRLTKALEGKPEADQKVDMGNPIFTTPGFAASSCSTGSFTNPDGSVVDWSCGCGGGGALQSDGCYHNARSPASDSSSPAPVVTNETSVPTASNGPIAASPETGTDTFSPPPPPSVAAPVQVVEPQQQQPEPNPDLQGAGAGGGGE